MQGTTWQRWMARAALALLATGLVVACDREDGVVEDDLNDPATDEGLRGPGEGVAGDEATVQEMAEGVTGREGDVARHGEAVESMIMQVDPGDDAEDFVNRAVAVLQPMEGSNVRGSVVFTADPEGNVRVQANVGGLPPGKHGYHVHLLGDCSAPDGMSAGPHFHFQGSSRDQADVDYITGNLGELEAGQDGNATAEMEVENASLQGRYSIIGRSVVVHEQGNDPSQPPEGGAGGRLACGVIGIDEPA